MQAAHDHVCCVPSFSFFAFPDSGCVSECLCNPVCRGMEWLSILFFRRCHRCKPHSLCSGNRRCYLTVPTGWHRIRVRSPLIFSSVVHWHSPVVVGNIPINKELATTSYPRMTAPTCFRFCKSFVAWRRTLSCPSQSRSPPSEAPMATPCQTSPNMRKSSTTSVRSFLRSLRLNFF